VLRCWSVEAASAAERELLWVLTPGEGLTFLVFANRKKAQIEALTIGATDVAVAARNRFPDDVLLQVACTIAVSTMIVFHRKNGLRAGSLGGLNRTLATYERGIEDPRVNTLGGAIGHTSTGARRTAPSPESWAAPSSSSGTSGTTSTASSASGTTSL
jgi:hypothetical protein